MIKFRWRIPHKSEQKLRTLLEELRNLISEGGEGVFGDQRESLIAVEEILKSKDLSKEAGAIRGLLAPTGNLQDLSIDCGWGEAFIRLASRIEEQL